MKKSSQQFISLKDEATVTLNIFSPQKEYSQTLILILPAMGVKASFYEPFAKELSEAGLLTIITDLRGLGTSSIRPSAKVDYGYLEMMEDLVTTIQQLKNQFVNRKIYLLGHSLGGQIASLALAKNPDLAEGLILVAANSVYYRGWSGRQRYMNLMAYTFFPLLSRLFGYFPGDKVGFGGKAAKTQLLDWGFVGRNGYFKIHGDSTDFEVALAKVTTSILAIYIEGDWMSPKAAMQHLYSKFNTNSIISTFTLTSDMVDRKLNHFNWVKNGEHIKDRIIKWLDGFEYVAKRKPFTK